MLTILINFGPRSVVPNHQYSLSFLLDYLKTIDPMIEFITHDQL